MLDGHVKLGGSGSVMNHKVGAGERRRRRRSLAMTQLPVSWLTPESTRIQPNSPAETSKVDSTPLANAEADVWALGIACIELFYGRPPKPEMPILASFMDPGSMGQAAIGDSMSGYSTPLAISGNTVGTSWGNFRIETHCPVRMGMSEEMWSFVARCLAPDPAERPRVNDLLEVSTCAIPLRLMSMILDHTC